MKNFVFFILGMITMLLVTLFIQNISEIKVLISSFGSTSNEQKNKLYMEGLMLFPEWKKEDIDIKEPIKVFKCLYQNVALVKAGQDSNAASVLILGEKEDYFYDDQKIAIPSGKQIKQIGVYKYENKDGSFKTIPVVSIK